MILGVQHFGAIPEIMVIGISTQVLPYLFLALEMLHNTSSLSQTSLPSEDNELSLVVNRLVKKIRSSKQHFMPLLVIR